MTEKRLQHIAVLSATLHGLLISFVLAYPLVALFRLFKSYDPQLQGYTDPTAWWVFWIAMPAVFALFGALMTAVYCVVYNLSARLLGGIRYKDHA